MDTTVCTGDLFFRKVLPFMQRAEVRMTAAGRGKARQNRKLPGFRGGK